MTYTYSQPVDGVFDNTVSNVRYLLRDTSPSAPFSLTDDEIRYELAQAGNSVRTAASRVAYSMSLGYSQAATTSKSVGNLSISRDYSKLASRYFSLSTSVKSGSTGLSVGVFTGGSDGDPQFYLGQFDNKD